jgi:hypothetical protein
MFRVWIRECYHRHVCGSLSLHPDCIPGTVTFVVPWKGKHGVTQWIAHGITMRGGEYREDGVSSEYLGYC